MEIESGFPSILDSEREGEDDYSIGGRGGCQCSCLISWPSPQKFHLKIKQFEKKLRKAKLCKKGVERGEL